jgi:hypothetical protein
MNGKRILLLLLKKDSKCQLLKKLINEHPELDKGFIFKELLNNPTLSWNEKVELKNIFTVYSEVFTPDAHFIFEGNKWIVKRIHPQLHKGTMKIINLMQKEMEYIIGSNVSTNDFRLIEVLIDKENELFTKEIGEKDCGYKINQEMLDFISGQLKQKLGEIFPLDYRFVQAFLESLSPYDQMMIEREFGG